jgi:hypothetical protein
MDAARWWLVSLVAIVAWNPALAVAQNNWQSGTTASPPSPAAIYDRYGQPIVSGAQTVTDRARTAFTETGGSLRDGLQAGVRAAEQSFSNLSAPANSSNTGRGTTGPVWPSTPGISSSAPSFSAAP